MSTIAMEAVRPHDRPVAVVSIVMVVALVGMIAGLTQRAELRPDGTAPVAIIDPQQDPRGHSSEFVMREIDERFLQAVAMLHAKEYDHAVTALHRILQLAPRMVEAHVNMGFALLGLENYGAARDFFQSAIDLRPFQANAYWGLAVALEKNGDLEGALGAMRAYIHLSPPDDPYVRKARSALWEWETTLARGPLPAAEREFLERGARQWEERNSAGVDQPDSSPDVIDLLPGR